MGPDATSGVIYLNSVVHKNPLRTKNVRRRLRGGEWRLIII